MPFRGIDRPSCGCRRVKSASGDNRQRLGGAFTLRKLVVALTLGAAACGGPYNDLEKAFPAKGDLQSKVLTTATVVLTSKKHSGAYSLRRVANIAVTSKFVEISVDKPFSVFHRKVQIPIEAITGCSKTCFGPGKWDADLLVGELGIQVSIKNSQQVLDWCWDNGLPIISGSARRAWMHEGKDLPGRHGYVQVSKEQYLRETRSACMGY